MFYFELVRRYGNIPLITSTEMSYQAPTTFTQATPDKVYEFIEDDLLYASEVLPYAIDDQLRENTSYRFSKGAALGLFGQKCMLHGQDILYKYSKMGRCCQNSTYPHRIRQTFITAQL